MRFEAFVAGRYLRGKRKNRFISLITVISVAGVCVGVMTLIVVMSVMTGFDKALTATIIGNRAHVTIVDFLNDPIDDAPALMRRIEAACPEVVASSPFIEIPGLLRNGRNPDISTFGFLLGVDVDLESKVTMLAENLTNERGRTHAAGRLPGEMEIILGHQLARNLGVAVGQPITVLTPNPSATPFGTRAGRSTTLFVSGIFQSQMSEYDAGYGFITLETARHLSPLTGTQVHGVHSRLSSNSQRLADDVARTIEEELGYRAISWYRSQEVFFNALQQEKLVMFIILAFIVLVAAFNITSTLIMVVMEKRRDIGILRTIGCSGRTILRLFVLEGLYIGLSGTLFGVLGGTVFAYYLNAIAEFIADLIGYDLFNSQIYYFDRIPVFIDPGDVMWISVSAVILTLVSTIYPAWSASRLDPVDALRYE